MVPPRGLQDDLQRDLEDDSQPMKKLYTNIFKNTNILSSFDSFLNLHDDMFNFSLQKEELFFSTVTLLSH